MKPLTSLGASSKIHFPKLRKHVSDAWHLRSVSDPPVKKTNPDSILTTYDLSDHESDRKDIFFDCAETSKITLSTFCPSSITTSRSSSSSPLFSEHVDNYTIDNISISSDNDPSTSSTMSSKRNRGGSASTLNNQNNLDKWVPPNNPNVLEHFPNRNPSRVQCWERTDNKRGIWKEITITKKVKGSPSSFLWIDVILALVLIYFLKTSFW